MRGADEALPHQLLGADVTHADAMAIMDHHADEVRRGSMSAQVLLTLEHTALVTAGRETLPGHIAGLPRTIPVVQVNRGGQATYHGPGILVGYPVIDLRRRADGQEPDLHRYLRALEDGVMRFVEQTHQLPCVRKPGFTGVWTHGVAGHQTTEPRKIAAIGIGCRRWVTTHGFALNIDPDLSVFQCFVPCGITDAETSSIAGEIRRSGRDYVPASMKEVADAVHGFVCRALQAEGWLTLATDDRDVEQVQVGYRH